MKKILSLFVAVSAVLGILLTLNLTASAAKYDNATTNSNAKTNASVAFAVPVGYMIDPNDPSKLIDVDDYKPNDNTVNTDDSGKTKVTKTTSPTKTNTTNTKSTNIPNSTGSSKAAKTGYSKLPQTGSSEISPVVLLSLVGGSLLIVFFTTGRELVLRKRNVVK